MEQILCPECGGNKVNDLGNGLYECRYCGKKFQLNMDSQPQQVNTTIGQPQPVYTQQSQVGNVPPQFNGMQQPQFNMQQEYTPDIDDDPGCLMNGLCFCIPLLGIILYFTKKETQPNCAKSYLTWALVGFGIGIAFNFLLPAML